MASIYLITTFVLCSRPLWLGTLNTCGFTFCFRFQRTMLHRIPKYTQYPNNGCLSDNNYFLMWNSKHKFCSRKLGGLSGSKIITQTIVPNILYTNPNDRICHLMYDIYMCVISVRKDFLENSTKLTYDIHYHWWKSICLWSLTEDFLKNSLTCHSITYTDQKLYTCKVFRKTFRRKVFLTAHIRSHTGENLWACDVCLKDIHRMVNYQIILEFSLVKALYQWGLFEDIYYIRRRMRTNFFTKVKSFKQMCIELTCHKICFLLIFWFTLKSNINRNLEFYNNICITIFVCYFVFGVRTWVKAWKVIQSKVFE